MKMSDVEKEKLLWLSRCHMELMNAASFEPMKLDVPLLREIASLVQSNDLGPWNDTNYYNINDISLYHIKLKARIALLAYLNLPYCLI